MKERYVRLHGDDFTDYYDSENTKQQQLNNEVMRSGAIGLYMFLWQGLVRKAWKDAPGYPIKRDYYDKGVLACSFSKNVLKQHLSVGERKVENWVKLLKNAKWINTERKTVNGQTIFVLGTWDVVNKKYTEILLKDEA